MLNVVAISKNPVSHVRHSRLRLGNTTWHSANWDHPSCVSATTLLKTHRTLGRA
jgi:hypothetical protein